MLPVHASVHNADWLASCHGFSVFVGRRRLGFVEEVGARLDAAKPDFLIVRSGFRGTELHVVPIDEVFEIRPRARRLRIGARPDGPRDRLRESLTRLGGRRLPRSTKRR